jgi:hypothetical protein
LAPHLSKKVAEMRRQQKYLLVGIPKYGLQQDAYTARQRFPKLTITMRNLTWDDWCMPYGTNIVKQKRVLE